MKTHVGKRYFTTEIGRIRFLQNRKEHFLFVKKCVNVNLKFSNQYYPKILK